jgi:hypothetical protein
LRLRLFNTLRPILLRCNIGARFGASCRSQAILRLS